VIIAVDGPAASGKGTLARRLAERYRLGHLDTGGLYRATGLRALLSGGNPADPQVAVAAARAVRLSDLSDPRVLDGRDIGTAVCPEADAKLFVTATLEARAMRRFKELQADDSRIIYERVLQDMKARDARDSERATAPLKRAPDALELDTTALDADAAFAAAVAFIAGKLAGKKR